MALSRVKTWIAGEVLTASDLNAEFNNILNNADDLISPLPGTLDLNGNELIIDADADTSITADTDDQIDFKLGGTDIIRFKTVASAVNGIDLFGSATGTEVYLQSFGTDSNVDIGIVPKGSGIVRFTSNIVLEGSTANDFETTIAATDPTADRTITLPDATGTVPLLGSNQSFTGINTFTAGIGSAYIQNLIIAASVGSNNLTVAIKGNDGNDPSATNIASFSIRSTTLTSGVYVYRALTAATSVVLPGTGTLGFTASLIGHIYVYMCDDGSSREVGLSRYYKDEGILHSTTAIGTGSDSAAVIYTTNGLTNAAIRWIGRIQIAAGASVNWTNAPTIVETWNPSLKKTGDLMQRPVTTEDITERTTTSSSFATMNVLAAITPTRASSILAIEATGILGHNTSALSNVTLNDSVDGELSALDGLSGVDGFTGTTAEGGTVVWPLAIYHEHMPQAVTARNIEIYAKTSTGTFYLGRRGDDTEPDVPHRLTVREICV